MCTFAMVKGLNIVFMTPQSGSIYKSAFTHSHPLIQGQGLPCKVPPTPRNTHIHTHIQHPINFGLSILPKVATTC